MNYCTKCASYYAQPGTCNCFAPPISVQPPASAPVGLPWVGDPPPYYPAPTPVISPWWGIFPPPATTTVTYTAPLTISGSDSDFAKQLARVVRNAAVSGYAEFMS